MKFKRRPLGGNVSAYRRIGVCKASSTSSRPPSHYRRVEKQSPSPDADTLPQLAAHFERNDGTIICETVHECTKLENGYYFRPDALTRQKTRFGNR